MRTASFTHLSCVSIALSCLFLGTASFAFDLSRKQTAGPAHRMWPRQRGCVQVTVSAHRPVSAVLVCAAKNREDTQ